MFDYDKYKDQLEWKETEACEKAFKNFCDELKALRLKTSKPVIQRALGTIWTELVKEAETKGYTPLSVPSPKDPAPAKPAKKARKAATPKAPEKK